MQPVLHAWLFDLSSSTPHRRYPWASHASAASCSVASLTPVTPGSPETRTARELPPYGWSTGHAETPLPLSSLQQRTLPCASASTHIASPHPATASTANGSRGKAGGGSDGGDGGTSTAQTRPKSCPHPVPLVQSVASSSTEQSRASTAAQIASAWASVFPCWQPSMVGNLDSAQTEHISLRRHPLFVGPRRESPRSVMPSASMLGALLPALAAAWLVPPLAPPASRARGPARCPPARASPRSRRRCSSFPPAPPRRA